MFPRKILTSKIGRWVITCVFAVLVFVLTPPAALAIFFFVVGFRNNVKAGAYKRDLDKITLPNGTIISREDILAGNIFSDTGNNLDLGAFRVLILPSPEDEGFRSLQEQIKKANDSSDAERLVSVFEYSFTGDQPDSTDGKIQAEISLRPVGTRFFVLYVLERHETSGTWDIRGF
jgi:hypothetical protein